MTMWELLEKWLFDNLTFGGSFDNRELADSCGIAPAKASAWIRSYLAAQRGPNSSTLYVLHRTGRTSNARWQAGVRTADARGISHQYFDDVRTRFVRAVEPDLHAIAMRNPRAAKQCRAIVEAVGDGAMKLLQVAVGGSIVDGDDPK